MKNIKSINFGAKGYYSLAVLDKNGKVVDKNLYNPTNNVVTYVGAYFSFVSQNPFTSCYCKVGTGTTEIVRAATDLTAPEAASSNSISGNRSGSEVDNGDGTSTLTVVRNFVFGLGAVTGTISEIGVFAGSVFVAGQLIKDEFGAATTVTLLADEQLTVSYTLEWTVPNVSVSAGTGTVTDNNSNVYTYEVWCQPYFKETAINDSETGSRYRDTSTVYAMPLFASGAGTGAMASQSLSVTRVDGVVTYSSGTAAWTPTDFTADVGYVSVMNNASNSAPTNFGLGITSPPTVLSGNNRQTSAVVEFTPAIPKTGTDTFAFATEFQINI